MDLQPYRWFTILILLVLLVSCTNAPGEPIPAGAPGSFATPSTLTGQPGEIIPTLPETVQSPPPARIDGPLSVVIDWPADNAIVSQSPLEIRGTADPETVISFNDEIVLVLADENFSIQVELSEGPNVIEIIASDAQGNQESFFLTVQFEPATP